MSTINSAYSGKLDLLYLGKFLNTNRIVMQPSDITYINALWSALDPPDQANLLSGLRNMSSQIVQDNEDCIVTLKALNALLVELSILTTSETQSYKHLTMNLAKKGFWKEAWEITLLNNDEDSKLTMLEWMSRTKIKLKRNKGYI